MAAPSLDLVCVSYLATADILRVASHPRRNHGAEILERIRSTAGDGTIAALTASALGLQTGLVANPVGADPEGEALVRHLEGWGVRLATAPSLGAQTPFLAIVDDGDGFRTWLAWVPPGAVDCMGRTDWSAMSGARLAYIDCYAIIGDAAVRAVEVAARLEVPMLLNLGGDSLTASLAAAAVAGRVLAVQTSVDTGDGDPDDVLLRAQETAEQLFDQLRPTASVVTIGRYGAVARTADGPCGSAAEDVPVRFVHGAGAAFSAGFTMALLAGRDVKAALAQGCAVGTAHCQGRIEAHRIGAPPSRWSPAPDVAEAAEGMR